MITQPTCTVTTGSVTLSGLPTTGTWTLRRNDGNSSTGTGATTNITGLPAGTYTYTVTNAAGCSSTVTTNIVINTAPSLPSPPSVGVITQPTCTVTTGSVALSGLPTTGTWTLKRSPNNISVTGTGATTNITGLTTGTYTFMVTNAAGCSSAASINVIINAITSNPQAPSVGVITQPTCTVATGSVVLNGLPTTGTWTLTRNPDNITTTGNGVTTTVSNLPVGIYTYTVTNASNCTSLATASILINATSNIPNAPLVSKVIEPACDSATGSIVLEGLPATGIWRINPIGQTGTGLSTTIKGLKIGEYTYTVSNDKGCTSPPTSIVISCKKDGSISCLDQLVNVIPNGFTPGGNGVNDYFDPEKYMDIGGCSSNIKAKELYIFNRWAELIFKGNPYEKWDGRITKQQHVVPSGAYYFIFVVEVENVRKSVKGVLNVFAD